MSWLSASAKPLVILDEGSDPEVLLSPETDEFVNLERRLLQEEQENDWPPPPSKGKQIALVYIQGQLFHYRLLHSCPWLYLSVTSNVGKHHCL